MSIHERFFALGKSFPRAALVKGRAFLHSLEKVSGMVSDLGVTLSRCTTGGIHNLSDEDLFEGLPLPRLSRTGESPLVATFFFGPASTGAHVPLWPRVLAASLATSWPPAGPDLAWILGVFRGLPRLRWTGVWVGAAWGAGWGCAVGICSAACRAFWTNNMDLLRKVTEAMGLEGFETGGGRGLHCSVTDMTSAGRSGSLLWFPEVSSPFTRVCLLFSTTTGKIFWQTEKDRRHICKNLMSVFQFQFPTLLGTSPGNSNFQPSILCYCSKGKKHPSVKFSQLKIRRSWLTWFQRWGENYSAALGANQRKTNLLHWLKDTGLCWGCFFDAHFTIGIWYLVPSVGVHWGCRNGLCLWRRWLLDRRPRELRAQRFLVCRILCSYGDRGMLRWPEQEVRRQERYRFPFGLGIISLQKSSSGLEKIGKERVELHGLFL